MCYIVSFLLLHWVHFSATNSKSLLGFIGTAQQFGDSFALWRVQYARS